MKWGNLTDQGERYMFLARDQPRSHFAYVEFRDKAGKANGANFLRSVVEAFSHIIRTVLTDNGLAFAYLPKNRVGPTKWYLEDHISDRVCHEH